MNIYIITYLASLLSNFCIMFFYHKIYDKNIKNKLSCLVIPLITIFSLLNAFNPNVILKLTVVLIVTFLIIFFTYNDAINRKAIGSIIIWLLINIFDFIVSIVVSMLITNNYVFYIINMKYSMILFAILILLFIYLLLLIPSFKKMLYIFTDSLLKIKYLYLYLSVILVFIVSFTTLSIINVEYHSSRILSVLLFISFIVLTIMIIRLILKYDNLSKDNDNLKNLNLSYLGIIQDYKVFKHNHRNKLLTIRNIGSNKVKELIDLQLKEDDFNISCLEGVELLPDSIKGLVWKKIGDNKYSNINIKLINQLESDLINDLPMKKYNDLCQSIGICLDNALEAAIETKNPEVMFIISNEKNRLIITIYNNFTCFLDVDKFGEKEYSTKNRNSGYGVYSLTKLKTVNIKNRIFDNIFETTISL